MKNCETCGIEVNVVMSPFADEVTGFIGENGVTCLKCAGLIVDSTDAELADAMGVSLRDEYEGDDGYYDDGDDFDPDYEDNAETQEREYQEHKAELRERWRNEY